MSKSIRAGIAILLVAWMATTAFAQIHSPKNSEKDWKILQRKMRRISDAPGTERSYALYAQQARLTADNVSLHAMKTLYKKMLTQATWTHNQAMSTILKQELITWARHIRSMQSAIRRQRAKPKSTNAPQISARRITASIHQLERTNRTLRQDIATLITKLPPERLKALRPPPIYAYNRFKDTTTISTSKIRYNPEKGPRSLDLWFSLTCKGYLTAKSRPPMTKLINMFLVSYDSNWQYLNSPHELLFFVDGRRTALSCISYDSKVGTSPRLVWCEEMMQWELPVSLLADIAKGKNVGCELFTTEFSLSAAALFKIAGFVDVLQLDKTGVRKHP